MPVGSSRANSIPWRKDPQGRQALLQGFWFYTNQRTEFGFEDRKVDISNRDFTAIGVSPETAHKALNYDGWVDTWLPPQPSAKDLKDLKEKCHHRIYQLVRRIDTEHPAHWAAEDEMVSSLQDFLVGPDLELEGFSKMWVAAQRQVQTDGLPWPWSRDANAVLTARGILCQDDNEASPDPVQTERAPTIVELSPHPVDPDQPRTTLTQTERRNDQKFRERVYLLQGSKCRVSGLDVDELLEACHIKPWSEATDFEKTDARNGIVLSRTLHKAFDCGFFTFLSNGQVAVSAQLTASQKSILGLDNVLSSGPLGAETDRYMAWHRKKFGFELEDLFGGLFSCSEGSS